MTTVQAEKIARRKLSLLQLTQELGNVSKACRIVGYSRQQFYEIRRSLQLHGADGLIDRLPGAEGAAPEPRSCAGRRGDPGPCAGVPDARCSASRGRADAEGIQVSSGGVRGVWMRNDLLTRHHRLLNNHALPFFEEHAVKVQTILSDNGREYCGRPDKHPYELFLQLEEIEHRTTKVGRPQSKGYASYCTLLAG